MQKTKSEKMREDYVIDYEKAILEVVKACGSEKDANKMLDELHYQYERTDLQLKKVDQEYEKGGQEYEKAREMILEKGKHEVHQIIEKHVPHVSGHLEELIMGTSLAVTASLLPAAHAASTLIAATSIIAIGSSYYIGFKLLRNWKAIAGKHRVAHLSHMMGPQHVNIPKYDSVKKK